MADKPLKIVRIMDRLNVGGPAVHAVLTSEGLSSEKTGGRVDTLLIHGHVTDDEEEMSHLFEGRPGLRRHVLPTLSRPISPLKDLRAFLSILWILLRDRPDVVHTHKSKAGALGRIAAWIARVPVRVHTFHGQVFEGYFSEGASENIVRVERFLSTLSHGVLAISPALREELERDYRIAHPDKLRVVPLGLDLEALANPTEKRRLQRELGLSQNLPAVGIVGRLVPIKNQALFLRAAAKVATRVPDLQVFVVG
ncbi:MAG: glycosyltransferase, partial [Chrysiogenetes bacterium]|nr:glycosyltransferase [Chrysiogenetes bacterium]